MDSTAIITQPSGWWTTNPDLAASEATLEDVEQYTNGESHVFAVALHRITGWPIHVVLDDDDHHWDFVDDESYIASAVHVVVEDAEGCFWDVKGRRPRDGFFEEMMALEIGAYDSDTGLDEKGLKYYVGCWAGEFDEEEVDRPLMEYSEADVAEAEGVVRRVLANIPGFPSSNTPGA